MEMHRCTLYYLSVLSVLHVCTCVTTTPTPNYTDLNCTGDGTITATVVNSIHSVVSKCNNHSNAYNLTTGDLELSIAKCPLNAPVEIYMLQNTYNSQANQSIISAKVIDAISVTCNGSGIKVTGPGKSYTVVSPKPVTIVYNGVLTMTLNQNGTGVRLNEKVHVGNKYSLQITADSNLNIHVQSCSATPGNGETEEVMIYDSGAPDPANNVLEKFDEATMKIAKAGMTGFRFIDSENVVITCIVDVSSPPVTTTTTTTTTTTAPLTPTIPSTTSTSRRRRRRSNELQQNHKQTVTVSTSFRVERLSSSGVQGMIASEGRFILIASILLVTFICHWF